MKYFELLFWCHRLPERSFFFHGKQFPLCARCTGIMLGYFVGIIYAFLFGKITMMISVLLLIPLVFDGTLQMMTTYESTNLRRFITGILTGVGTDYLLFWIARFGFENGKTAATYLFFHS